MLAVLDVVLERVDGDDDPIEVVERVHARRDLGLHPLDAHRVQAHERDREAAPKLLLELRQDRLHCDDKDASATPSSDEFGEQHANLDRLPESHAVGHQEPGP